MTSTPNIGLILPSRDSYLNTWDFPVNGNFSIIDSVLGGTLNLTAQSTPFTLSQAQCQCKSIVISGQAANTQEIVMPQGVAGIFTVLNATTGGQPCYFLTEANTATVLIGPGIRVAVFSDGNGVYPLDQSQTPPGSMFIYPGVNPPYGFVLANGQALSRTTFAGIFAAIGTIYGAGDGSTTFNVPDLRGMIVAGLDNMGGIAARGMLTSFGSNGQQLGAIGGEQAHTLAVGELPAHSHGVNDPGHLHSLTDPGHTHHYNHANIQVGISGNDYGAVPSLTADTTSNSTTGITENTATTGISVANAGGGGAHNNVQPTILLNWIIKV